MNEHLIEQLKAHLIRQGHPLPFPPATEDSVKKTEQEIGFSLPPLLRTIYLQIGNGGFGPSNGIIGVEGGYSSDLGDLASTYFQLGNGQAQLGNAWDERMLLFCSWGCNIYTCVKCDANFQISIFEDARLWPKTYNLEHFFQLWLEGADILAYESTFEEHTLEFTNRFTGRHQVMKTRHRLS
jgi:hypothetical protein